MADGILDGSRDNNVGQLMGRILLVVIGMPMASFMTIVGLHEIAVNNFFGASVSFMVAIFGFQLMLIGIRGPSDSAEDTGDADPLRELWRSDARVCPYRPYSNLDIRGR